MFRLFPGLFLLSLCFVLAVSRIDYGPTAPQWFNDEVNAITSQWLRIAVFTNDGLYQAINEFDLFASANQKPTFFTDDDTVNKIRLAALLGNVRQETGQLQFNVELAPPAYSQPCTIASGLCAPSYGIYFGRGALQMTCWGGVYCSAYADTATFYGITDMETNPDQMASNPVLAWGSAVIYFMTNTGYGNQGPAVNWIAKHSFGGTYATINGGLECVENSAGISDTRVSHRIDGFLKACAAANVDCSGYDLKCPPLPNCDRCVNNPMLSCGRDSECNRNPWSTGPKDTCNPCVAPTVPPGSTIIPTVTPSSTTSSTTSNPSKTTTSAPTTTSSTKNPVTTTTTSPATTCSSSDPQFICKGCDLFQCDFNTGFRVVQKCAPGTTCSNGMCIFGTCEATSTPAAKTTTTLVSTTTKSASTTSSATTSKATSTRKPTTRPSTTTRAVTSTTSTIAPSSSCTAQDPQFVCNGCDLFQCNPSTGFRVIQKCAPGTTCMNGACVFGSCGITSVPTSSTKYPVTTSTKVPPVTSSTTTSTTTVITTSSTLAPPKTTTLSPSSTLKPTGGPVPTSNRRVVYISPCSGCGMNWNNNVGSNIIDAVNGGYNVIILTFLVGNNVPLSAADAASIWIQQAPQQWDPTVLSKQAVMDYVHSKGAIVLVAYGGEAGATPYASVDPKIFGTAAGNFVADNLLDGVDFDLENFNEGFTFGSMSSSQVVQWIVDVTKSAKATMIARGILNSVITHAPQAPYFGRIGVDPKNLWNVGPSGGYTAVYAAVGDMIDWFNVQYYNQFNPNPSVANPGCGYSTYEYLFEQSGVGCSGTSVMEISSYGIPLNKLVVGKYTLSGDAGGWNIFVTGSELGSMITEARSKLGYNAGVMVWRWRPAVSPQWIADAYPLSLRA